MSVFVTDKRIETLTYDLICTRKDLKEMTLLVQTNSTTIADLLGLIREQNKSLTELRREVESLKSELSVLKKVGSALEKVDQSEVSVESKTTVEEEIKPEDKPFRHFQFDKSWEELPAVKEWGDSKVVYGIYFNLTTRQQSGTRIFHPSHPNILNERGLIGSNFIQCEIPINIKDSILIVENFFKKVVDKSYIGFISELSNRQRGCNFPIPMLTFSEYLNKQTVKGYFLCCNKIHSIELNSSDCILNVNIY
jgi:hypothetical protein